MISARGTSIVYVPGPHSQNDLVTFSHTLADDPSRMFPLYLYSEDGSALKGVGEYGVDFSGTTAPFGVFGTGADGDLTVTNGQTIYTDNTRSALAATANSGQSNLALASSSGFANGQEVLVVQVQGTGAGNYEFGTIASIASNTLGLSKNLTNIFTVGGNSKAQVIRVLQYHDLTVQSGGTLTAHPWDGSTGGIVAFRASGTVTVSGTISADGKGFRGGGQGTSNGQALQGEYYGGIGGYSYSANYGAGGGGKQPDGAAGGGGGYATVGGTGGQRQSGTPGIGGGTYGVSDLSTIYFGSGGGTACAGIFLPSGIGGGIVYISGAKLTVTGTISSNGMNGTGEAGNSGGGGGGAGGSIFIKGKDNTLGTNLIAVAGGAGGVASGINGGAGGNGRIRIEYGTMTGTTNPAASTQQVNYYNVTGQNAPFGVFGSGSDGDLTITSGQTIYTDNTRSALASTANNGQSNLVLASAAEFANGQEVLVIQIQGNGVGNYEFASISSINGTE